MKLMNQSKETIIEKSYLENVPIRFQNEVKLFLFKNEYANLHHDFRTPLILSICGAPGMGKTYQTKCILESLNYKICPMSGSEFESSHAGVPAENIKKLYYNTSEDIFFKKINKGIILIDDIDSAIGEWGSLVQYTMNRQLVIKTLIDLADNPYSIKISNYDEDIQIYNTQRIPFIVTLNDEKKMYGPLMRNGRTHIFPWVPNREEILEILKFIFRDVRFSFNLSKLYDDLTHHTKSKIELPIALFSDIRTSLYDSEILSIINENGVTPQSLHKFECYLSNSPEYSYEQIYNLGISLIHESHNYLIPQKKYIFGFRSR